MRRKHTLERSVLLLIALLSEMVAIPVCVPAQEESAFEAVVIKRAEHGPLYPRLDTDPGYLSAKAASVHFLIRQAFGLEEFQLIDTGGWVKTDLYSIYAAAGKATSTAEMMAMLRTLLASRFHLAYHREARQTTVYALTVDKSGAKLVPINALDNPLTPNKVNGSRVTRPVGSSVQEFVRYLNSRTGAAAVGLPVVDNTGLQGLYRIRLTFEATRNAENNGGRYDIDWLTEIPKQLGLRLKQAKASINMLIVDSVSKPDLDQ